MKRLGQSLLIALLAAIPALAQGPTCNENRANAVVQSELASCIADARRDDFLINFETVCACPGTGYTITVIGTPHCRPGEICPLIARLVGTAQLDCDFNVISATCGVAPPA